MRASYSPLLQAWRRHFSRNSLQILCFAHLFFRALHLVHPKLKATKPGILETKAQIRFGSSDRSLNDRPTDECRCPVLGFAVHMAFACKCSELRVFPLCKRRCKWIGPERLSTRPPAPIPRWEYLFENSVLPQLAGNRAEQQAVLQISELVEAKDSSVCRDRPSLTWNGV